MSSRLPLHICVRLLLCVALWLAASAARAEDVTGATAIKRSGLVFNRTTQTFDATVTVTNTGARPILSPVHLVVVLTPDQASLANATGLTAERLPYIELRVPGGRLNLGESVKTSLKVKSPSREGFVASFNVEARIEESGALPPDPGPAGDATLLGIDTDNDGVRDDVQRYIALNYSNSEKTQRALADIARAYQSSLVVPLNSQQLARDIAIELDTALDCLYYIMEVRQAIDASERLFAEFMNTASRYRQHGAFTTQLAGQSFEVDDPVASSCKFNPGILPN